MNPHARADMEKRFPGITERDLFVYFNVMKYHERVAFLKDGVMPASFAVPGLMTDVDRLLTDVTRERDELRARFDALRGKPIPEMQKTVTYAERECARLFSEDTACDAAKSGDCAARFYVGVLVQTLEKMEAERSSLPPAAKPRC